MFSSCDNIESISETSLGELVVVTMLNCILRLKLFFTEDCVIQWGSEYCFSLVFKWSKVVQSTNGPEFQPK